MKPPQMHILNCCDHKVEVLNERNGNVTEFWPSNMHARVPLTTYTTKLINDNVPVLFVEEHDVANLPDPYPNVMYIVSGIVFNKTNRTDVLKPDAGEDAIRIYDSRGEIERMVVKRLIGKKTF